MVKERDETSEACFESLGKWNARIASDWTTPCARNLEAQKKSLDELQELAVACRDLAKDVDVVFKLATRLVDVAEKDGNAREHEDWDGRAIAKLEKELEAQRKDLVEQLKLTLYFERQGHWLLSRFPEAQLVPVPGLVKLVDKTEIDEADWSLTPGRHVSVAPRAVDEGFDFEQTLRDIHLELDDLNHEALMLAEKIKQNFEELGL